MFRRALILTLVMVMAVVAWVPLTGTALATGTVYGSSATFYCERVQVSYGAYGYGLVQFRVVDTGNTVVGGPVSGSTDLGSHTVNIPLSPVQAEGTSLKVQFMDGGGFWYDLYSPGGIVSGDCVPAPVVEEPEPESETEVDYEFPPYWLIGWVGARLSVRTFDDGVGNPVLTLYRISEESEGTLIFFMTAKMLDAEYPADPDGPVVIFESDDGLYRLSRMPSGEFEVSVGPDAEGKVHLVYFTGVPPQGVHIDSYYVPLSRLPAGVARFVRAVANAF